MLTHRIPTLKQVGVWVVLRLIPLNFDRRKSKKQTKRKRSGEGSRESYLHATRLLSAPASMAVGKGSTAKSLGAGKGGLCAAPSGKGLPRQTVGRASICSTNNVTGL
ncbi:hypothetical protein NE237_028722 [Protea cynaroides]|uniref:Uncharacterized protein n=1 Tax=Protea cynaroides TaxID=273540 RepID=A0A9Q0JVE6_9MAGN|nr:hypothetical protein NE237_028722 [Protea cynaroides]